MSKKKKSKKKYYGSYGYITGGSKKANKKSGKKGKKDKSYEPYEAPRLKTVKPSLDKRDAKENKKIIMTPIDIPGKFAKNRHKCNHAGELITPAQFRALTPNYAAYTPWLERAVTEYGEDNVRVCKSCYDVICDTAKISAGDIETALVVLYAAANAVVSHRRMKTDEIKEIAKLREALSDWHVVQSAYADLEKKGAFADESVGGIPSPSDLSALNQVDGTTPMVT